ncbi:MAG: MFS transporter [Bifidobacteriaceae bacterium]|nr:MFS transporter [Bifidobacteriaceae bacterium]
MRTSTVTASASAPAPAAAGKPAKPGKLPKSVTRAAWAVALGAIAPMLASTMMNIAVAPLAKAMHAGLGTIQWAITGYVLALAVAVPFSGWLQQRLDAKTVFLWAELAFCLTSVAAGCTGSAGWLIAARLAQGAAAGIITPLSTSILVRLAGADALGRLTAIVGTPMVLGPILGPVLGGFLIQAGSWRWIFFINVLFAAAGLIVLWLVLPSVPPVPVDGSGDGSGNGKRPRLDWLGLTEAGAGSALALYGISELASLGSGGAGVAWRAAGCLVAGVALFGLYIWHAHRVGDAAIVPLSLFHLPSFTGSGIAMLFTGLLNNGLMLVLPLYFQELRGLSVTGAALALIPQGVGMMAIRPLAGLAVDRVGARRVVWVGLALTFAGSVPLIWAGAHTGWALLVAALLVRGAGLGALTMPLMTDAYTGVDPALVPHAGVGQRIIQNVGGAAGSAVMATVLAGVGVGAGAAGAATGFHVAFLVATLASFVIALVVPKLSDKRKPR